METKEREKAGEGKTLSFTGQREKCEAGTKQKVWAYRTLVGLI